MDHTWMGEALREAEQALRMGDVPIGAVVVKDGRIIGRGRNEIERRGAATAHAEMLALEEAFRHIGDWRLDGCAVYCTVEPCHMCFGACYHSRVARVVYGARAPRSGACGSRGDLREARLFNHDIEVLGAVREEESVRLLQEFFRGVRSANTPRRDARAG
ncbi:MAG TPA: nucleoside deaminase [Candidatus Eisenbacteria bacterium]|uniref:tRNA-specific adenosine deaminase n=1 Tax=Eiseniibacteriota bacterium TaxID=2212470 RepID=A0A7V2F4A5_UNCEI|nr:nucleoside deaminase [Candidatus Eisenbacteria bacterium]